MQDPSFSQSRAHGRCFLETAEALPDIEIKKQFMDLARQWRELAKHAKRREEERLKKAARLMLAR